MKVGQIKFGACVTKDLSFNTPGCELAYKNLPNGASSQECKVLQSPNIPFHCSYLI